MYRQIFKCKKATKLRKSIIGGGGQLPPCPPSGYANVYIYIYIYIYIYDNIDIDFFHRYDYNLDYVQYLYSCMYFIERYENKLKLKLKLNP